MGAHYFFAADCAPHLNGLHFAVFGLAVFAITWYFRAKIATGPIVALSAGLTYSIYLFHHWLFPYFKKQVLEFGLTSIYADAAALAALFAVCFCMTQFVEKKGIATGKWILRSSKA